MNAANAERRRRKTKFHTVNRRRYLPLCASSLRPYILKEINEARDAIKVPNPPMSVPNTMAVPFAVKWDRRIAAGTLEIT
jgi:hypothetical protein